MIDQLHFVKALRYEQLSIAEIQRLRSKIAAMDTELSALHLELQREQGFLRDSQALLRAYRKVLPPLLVPRGDLVGVRAGQSGAPALPTP